MRKRFVIWLGSISLLLAVPLDVPTQAAPAPEVFSPQFGLLLGPREASAGRGRRGFGFAGARDPVRGRLIDRRREQ